MPDSETTARVVIISDSKRGHENQSRVLARMLGDSEPVVMLLKDSVKNGGISELLLRLKLRLGGVRSINQTRAAQLVQSFLHPDDNQAFRDFAVAVKEYPDRMLCTVSSGTPAATFNLVMSRMLGSRSVVNMSPSLLPHSMFDLVVLPEHDLKGREAADNEISTPLALGFHDETAAQHLAARLKSDNNLDEGPYWGVAIGGPSKACRWEGDVILDELAKLHGLARGSKTRLLVTTSRRTPEYCLAWLNKHYRNSEFVPYFLDANVDPLNPLPAFYELCDSMFVTSDSFSMVSEAVIAGHMPVMLRVQPAPPVNKLGRALGSLAKTGHIVLNSSDSEELPQRVARSRQGRITPNAEYFNLRDRVISRLFGS